MKQLLFRRFVVSFLFLAVSTLSWAYDFESNGIYYNKNSDGTSVTVTYMTTSYNSYSGSVTIPSKLYISGKTYSVTSIGYEAFYNCSGLTSVTIPNSVTSIGDCAFRACGGLTSVTIPNSVTSIGEGAFFNCSRLTSVTIPNSVTSIGDAAFRNCSGLTSITIPNSVTSIGRDAFDGCRGLTKAEFASIESLCNISFGKSSANPLYYAKHLYINGQEVKDLVIPNSVTSIGRDAFDGCRGLTSVTIPNSVTSIGAWAFSDCSGLTSVTIGNSVTSIGSGAFYGCSGLTKAEFASIESLCNISFGGSEANPLRYAKHLYINGQEVTDLVIPNSVTSIGGYAFYGCSGLTSVTIPNSVTSIGEGAFEFCSDLTSVTIGNSVTSIGSSAFYGCSGLTSVTIPNSVTSIGNYAFYNCTGLASVIIGNSVTSIGNNAFNNCSGLTSVSLNSNEIVSKSYTTGNNLKNIFGSQVKDYILGDDVNGIGDYAFYNFSSLASINIGNGMTSIGYAAFYNCSGLTSVTIPNSVTSIGGNAFSGCTGLTSVTIPNSVTSIGGYAFSGCSGLTSVTLNSNKIVSKKYTYSSNFTTFFGSQVKEYVLGDDVKGIGSYAFYGCSGLTSVTIGNSVTTIESYAFEGCSGLTSLKVEEGNPRYDSRNNCNAIIESSTNTLIAGCKNTTIPNSVTSIGSSAFYGCSGLTSITIPNSVTSIGNGAFRNCSGLTLVTIPNSVTSIGNYAFYNCTGLASVIIGNSVTSIGNDAYPATTKIYVDNGVLPLIAVWKYGISPYDLSTNTCLTNPFDTRICSNASSIGLLGSVPENLIKIENESLTIDGVTKSGQNASITGLTPKTSYQFQYNATITYGDGSSTYTKDGIISTEALTLTTSQPKVISVGNAVVGAISNLDDAEENVGFEWRRTDWTDDFASNTGVAYLYEGTMEGYIRNLYTEKLWKVRPYYKDNTGQYYYGDWVGLDPTNTSYFEPTVHTYARIDQTEDKVQISGYVQRGTDTVSKQGFKYWIQENNGNARGAGISIPSGAKTVEAEGRVMEVELTGLKPNTTYAYVAFVTTVEGETFYGKQLSFTTGDDPEASVKGDANGNGVVEIGDVTSVLTLMATPEATGYNNKAADANGNGEIEIGDVTTILTIMANN